MLSRIYLSTVLLLGSPLCAAPAETTIEKTTYRGFEAFRLSDGRSEAIVVPATGSVLRFGLVGSFNWLWNLPPAEARAPKPYRNWRNWGGDKTWLAPQNQWPTLAGRDWPPDPAWGNPPDGPHQAKVLAGGILRLEGPVSQASGLQISRQYHFHNSEFFIVQTVTKKAGTPVTASIWSDTAIVRPEAVFALANSQSPYPSGFYLWPGSTAQVEAPTREGTLLCFQPARGGWVKRGLDSPVAALAAYANGEVFVQRAGKPVGDYPDGAQGAGFPVEIYDTGDHDEAESRFVELELLGPLRPFFKGAKWTHTVRWHLQKVNSPQSLSPSQWSDLLSSKLDSPPITMAN